MQKRGETQKGFLVALLVIIVAVVGVSYLNPGSTGKAIGTVDAEGAAGEDKCPNPTSSGKMCRSYRICHYKCKTQEVDKDGKFKDVWFPHQLISEATRCPDVAGCTFEREESALDMPDHILCAVASTRAEEPSECIPSYLCENLGAFPHYKLEGDCCTVTWEKNCVEKKDVR